MCSMQAPKKKMSPGVHIGTLFPSREKPGVPSRAQGLWGQQRHEDGEECPRRRSEEGGGFVSMGGLLQAKGSSSRRLRRVQEGS